MEEIQIYIYLSDIIKLVTNTNLLRSCRQLLDTLSQSSLLPDYKGAVAVVSTVPSPFLSLVWALYFIHCNKGMERAFLQKPLKVYVNK